MALTEPDLTKVLSWPEFLKLDLPDPEDREYGEMYYDRAKKFLESHDVGVGIQESFLAMIYPHIMGMYLFKTENKNKFGEWFWVIVGDIPSALFSSNVGHNPGMALDVYLGEMSMWVEAVYEGKPVDDLVPVNAPPTKEYADMLLSRLKFIGENILMEEYKDDLGYDPDAVE